LGISLERSKNWVEFSLELMHAARIVLVTVLAPVFDDAPVHINLAGTNNKVTGLGDQNFTIVVTNGGAGKFTLGDGNNMLTTDGNNNVITEGTSDEPGGDTVLANGNANSITLGDGDNKVTANGNNDAIKLGDGGNSVIADGNTDVITVGDGNNSIEANGNNDTIALGTGNNSLSATGDSDTITASNGRDAISLGSNSHVALTATKLGTSIDSTGAQNSIVLNNNANARIMDETTGGALNLIINAQGAANAGKIVLTGFGDAGDTTGQIDLQGFAGITNASQLLAVSTSDGAGGTLIHLGTGSLQLVAATINTDQFAFS